jgi:hypothetical protein
LNAAGGRRFKGYGRTLAVALPLCLPVEIADLLSVRRVTGW